MARKPIPAGTSKKEFEKNILKENRNSFKEYHRRFPFETLVQDEEGNPFFAHWKGHGRRSRMLVRASLV